MAIGAKEQLADSAAAVEREALTGGGRGCGGGHSAGHVIVRGRLGNQTPPAGFAAAEHTADLIWHNPPHPPHLRLTPTHPLTPFRPLYDSSATLQRVSPSKHFSSFKAEWVHLALEVECRCPALRPPRRPTPYRPTPYRPTPDLWSDLASSASLLHFLPQRLGNHCTVCAVPLFTESNPVERRALLWSSSHSRPLQLRHTHTHTLTCTQLKSLTHTHWRYPVVKGEGSQSFKRMNLLNLSSPHAGCSPPPPPQLPTSCFFELLSLFLKIFTLTSSTIWTQLEDPPCKPACVRACVRARVQQAGISPHV